MYIYLCVCVCMVCSWKKSTWNLIRGIFWRRDSIIIIIIFPGGTTGLEHEFPSGPAGCLAHVRSRPRPVSGVRPPCPNIRFPSRHRVAAPGGHAPALVLPPPSEPADSVSWPNLVGIFIAPARNLERNLGDDWPLRFWFFFSMNVIYFSIYSEGL